MAPPNPTPAPGGNPPPPAATPKPIDQAKATEALNKFKEALTKSADASIQTEEGAKEARTAMSAAFASLKGFSDVWADQARLADFASKAGISVGDLTSTLTNLQQAGSNLANAFNTSFPKIIGAGDAMARAAAGFGDAAVGQAIGATVVELDKVILRMKRYADTAKAVASTGADLGGVGGTNLGLQRELLKSGLLDPQVSKDLNTHLLKSMGHVDAQRDALMGMWEETKRQLPLLAEAKAAVEEQLKQVGDRKLALDKEAAELAKTMSYQQASARAEKEKELKIKERELAQSEQSMNERAAALEAERGANEVSRSFARQATGEERRLLFEQVMARDRDIAAREAVLATDKENLTNQRTAITEERAQLEEGKRLASDRTALEADRASIAERTRLAEEEGARIAEERSNLQRAEQEYESRKATLTAEQQTAEQAILTARKEKLNADETANNTEKAAIAETEKNTAYALSLYQDKAKLDQDIAFFDQMKVHLGEELTTINDKQLALEQDKANFARISATLSDQERAQRQAALADRQALIDQERAQNLENTAQLERERRLTDEANRLYTDRTALDAEIASLTARETAATAEESALATETTKLADDRRALAQQTNISDEEKARKEEEFNRKEAELADRQRALTAERALIQEERNATTAVDAIVRANEREAIRKSNQAASDREIAARREAVNAEEEGLKKEKDRLENSIIDGEKRQYALISELNSINRSAEDLVRAVNEGTTAWMDDFKKTIGKFDANIDYQKSVLGLSRKWAILDGNNVQYWRDQLKQQEDLIKLEEEKLREEIDAYEELRNSAEGLSESAQEAMEAAIAQRAAAIAQMKQAQEKARTDTSPITMGFKEAIKPLITEVKRTAEFQDARFNVIGTVAEMGWFAARTEAKRLKEEEKFFQDRKKAAEVEMRTLEQAFESGQITREEFQTSFAEAAKDLKEFADAEKTTKSRRKEVEERQSKGILGNQLEKLNKAMENMTNNMKKAAGHWITKLLLMLVVLGFMIRRGILSPSRIAKVVALIVDFVVKGIKALFKLIIIGLIAVVKSIFMMFAQGNILAGVISTLVFVIVSLLVLAHIINLASIGWAKIAGAATTISSAFMTFSDGLKKLAGIDLAGFFEDLGGKLKDGFKKMFGMVTDKVTGGAAAAAQGAVPSGQGRSLRDGLFPKQAGQTGAAATPRAGVVGAATVGAPGAAGAVPSAQPPKGASKFSGFLKGLADNLKQLGSGRVVRGAATLALLATAVMMIAAAFVLFSKVSWQGVVIGLGAIFGLVHLTKMLAKAIIPIMMGAVAMKVLAISIIFFSGALLTLAIALVMFNNVEWGSLLKAGLAIVMFGFLLMKIVPFAPLILAGALTIALVGLALLPFVFAMSFMKGFELSSVLILALGIYTLTVIVASMAFLLPWVILGGLTIAAVGLAIMPMAIALQLAKGIQLGSALVLALATYLFASIAYTFAEMAQVVNKEDIIKGSLMIGLIGAAILPMSLALQLARGIEIGSAMVLIAATFLFGLIAYGITQLAKFVSMDDIIKGGLIMGMIGVALLPMATALLMAGGIKVGAAALLATAVIIFSGIAYTITLLSKLVSMDDVLKGGLIIGLIGLAMIPLAMALHAARGIELATIGLMLVAVTTFGLVGLGLSYLAQAIPWSGLLKGAAIIALIGFAVMPMAWALSMVKGIKLEEALILLGAITVFTTIALLLGAPWMVPLLPMIFVGAAVIFAIGLAVLPMAQALQAMKGVEWPAVGILLVAVAGFTAIAIGIAAMTLLVPYKMILFGVAIMYLVGLAVMPMAHALHLMKGVEWTQMWILMVAVAGFSAIAILIGALTKVVPYKAILQGVSIMALVGLAVLPMAFALSLVKGVQWEELAILASAVLGFAGIAMLLGSPWFIALRPMIEEGAFIIALIGLAVLPMAFALSLVKGLSLESVAILVGATLGFAAIAAALGWVASTGVGAAMILAGVGIIFLIGLAIRPMIEALSLAKGLEPESIRAIVEATFGFALIAAGLGLLIFATGGLGAVAIAAGAAIIYMIGMAILPMAYALSLAKGLNPADLDVLELAIRKFLSLALSLSWYGLLLPLIAAGALVMQIIGGAVLPMAEALSKAKGLDVESVIALAIATEILVMAAIWAGSHFVDVFLGALALMTLGHAMVSLGNGVSKMKGLTGEDAIGMGMAIISLVNGAIYAGQNFISIMLGAWALSYLGEAISTVNKDLGPFAESMEKLSKLPEPLLKLAETLERLGMAISAFSGELGSIPDAEFQRVLELSASVSSGGGGSSSGGLMEEIRDILKETKEIHMQQGGNNVVAMNQSNVSSQNTSVEPPIVKNNRAVDHYFSRLSFKHHL
jgi:hypothetical protein